ncbi:MAG: TolC family protein [Polyangiaceae bacterium]|nr:TolC family protein [Polyangiaceae bacterium]
MSVRVAVVLLLSSFSSLALAQPTSALEVDAFEVRARAVVARPGGLTAQEAGRLAGQRSLEVRLGQRESDVARAELERAVVSYLPRLTVGARYTRLSPLPSGRIGPDGANLVATPAGEGPLPPGAPLVGVPASALSFPVILDQYVLQAGVVVPLSDYLLRTGQSHTAAREGVAAAELTVTARRRAASASGQLAYHDWVRATLAEIVADQGVEQAERHLSAAETLRELDRAVDADIMTARARVARAELARERARSLVDVSEQQLRTMLREPSGVLRIGDDPFRPLPNPGAESAAALTAEALRKRPELRALERTASSLANQSRAARGAGLPRLDAFANAYYANPSPRVMPQRDEWRATWDVGAQLSWTPNDLPLASASSAALDARRAAVELERARLGDALRTEVVRAERALREAHHASRVADRGLLAAREAYRARLEQFRAGRLTSVELADAETELAQARLEVIDARVGWRAARVRLDYVVGR